MKSKMLNDNIRSTLIIFFLIYSISRILEINADMNEKFMKFITQCMVSY